MKKVGKGCLGCLGAIVLMAIVGLVAMMFFGSSTKSEITKSSVKQEVKSKIKDTVTDAKKKIENNFEPKDVTDETIRTIKNYGDYLAMYQYIYEDYLKNYEAKMTELGLTDEESRKGFEDAKKQFHDQYDQMEKQYGIMNEMPIPEGGELTNELIALRDELRQSLELTFSTFK